jgi:hypothetical protein
MEERETSTSPLLFCIHLIYVFDFMYLIYTEWYQNFNIYSNGFLHENALMTLTKVIKTKYPVNNDSSSLLL